MRGFGGRWRALGSGAGAATAIGVLIVLSAFSGGAASRPGTPVPPAAALLHLAITGTGCSGAGVPTRFTGQLSDLGGPTPRPSIANQTVALTVHYDQDFFPFGGNATRQCLATTHSATTGSLGSFSISASIPTNYCVKSIGCWNFTGPYGPATFNLTGSGSVPPGDYLTQSIWGSSVTLSRVAALDRVALDPSGFATVSVLAPSNLSASALAGDGSASPAAPSYAWRIVGSGWSFLSATTVARPVVEAQAGAAVATAELWVNGSFGGAALHLPPVSVILTAAATSVTAGAVAPTSVDAGEPTTFSYSGTGAVGYPYTASVSPGLGLPPVAATCRASQLSGGLDRLDCAATIDYPDAGIAQPSANLSNGYSTATWDFAPVTVASALDVRVVPAPALAYRDAPVTFALSVAAGTGTPPFGPACLDPGSGGFECDNGPGPTWTFDVAYPSTGNFSARLTASDAGGSSWARTVPIRIVDRPQLAPLALASSIVGLGGELSADTSVSGGGLPISFWWNLSTPASTVASGTLTNDGPIALDAALAELGPGRLTLTLVDALGTRSSSVADYVVLPETATEIVALGPSNDSIAAGRPLSLSFEALDGLGNRVIGFVGPVAIVVHGSDGPTLWVNASQSGPVPPSASGGFDPPSTAWRSGYLNLTLASVLAGSISVALEAAPGVLGTPPWPITVVPDTSREHLFGPTPPAALDRSPGTDSALYQIRDRFGNPLDGGYVVIRTLDRGTVLTVIDSPIFVRSGLSMVWVNYSAVDGLTVYVQSETGQGLLDPIEVGASSGTSIPLAEIAGLIALAGGIGVAGALGLRRRARLARAPPAPPPSETAGAVEDGLRRLAEGRAHVLARVTGDRALSLAEIAEGFDGPPPDPSELAEWVSALVTEGLLAASIAPDGRPVFRRASPPEPPKPLRVEVDPNVLEAALARRDVLEGDDGTPPDASGGSDPP